MKGIILLNGDEYHGAIDDAHALVYCCDGAYNWAKGRVRIDENIGDFDSVCCTPDPPPERIYPSEKDYTDGEIALLRMLAKKVDRIEIYGAGGGREDHFLGNLQLLYKAYQSGVPAVIVTDYNRIFLFGEHFMPVLHLKERMGTTVSFLPVTETAKIGNASGFYYPLSGVTLKKGTCLGISNVVTEEAQTVECQRGTVIAFVNQKKR